MTCDLWTGGRFLWGETRTKPDEDLALLAGAVGVKSKQWSASSRQGNLNRYLLLVAKSLHHFMKNRGGLISTLRVIHREAVTGTRDERGGEDLYEVYKVETIYKKERGKKCAGGLLREHDCVVWFQVYHDTFSGRVSLFIPVGFLGGEESILGYKGLSFAFV